MPSHKGNNEPATTVRLRAKDGTDKPPPSSMAQTGQGNGAPPPPPYVVERGGGEEPPEQPPPPPLYAAERGEGRSRWSDCGHRGEGRGRRRLPMPESEGRGSGSSARTTANSLCRCARAGTRSSRALLTHRSDEGERSRATTIVAAFLPMGEEEEGSDGGGHLRAPSQPVVEVAAFGIASDRERIGALPGTRMGRRTVLGFQP